MVALSEWMVELRVSLAITDASTAQLNPHELILLILACQVRTLV